MTSARLFGPGDRPWKDERLTRVLARETKGLLGLGLTTSSWRHLAIANDRRHLRDMGSRLLRPAATDAAKAEQQTDLINDQQPALDRVLQRHDADAVPSAQPPLARADRPRGPAVGGAGQARPHRQRRVDSRGPRRASAAPGRAPGPRPICARRCVASTGPTPHRAASVSGTRCSAWSPARRSCWWYFRPAPASRCCSSSAASCRQRV